MATIVTRGPHQHQVIIRRKGYRTQTKTFEDPQDADAWAKETEAKMYRGDFADNHLARNTTLDSCLERYAAEVTVEKKGTSAELSKIRILRKHPIARLKMAEVRSAHVANYLADRKKRVLGQTAARELCVLSSVFEHARKNWGYEGLKNPCDDVTRPKPGKPRKHRISDHEIDILCAHTKSPLLGAALRLAAETALRRGELVKLLWKDIDLEKRTLYLPDTKNGDDRAVPLSKKAVTLLLAMPRNPNCDLVFPIRADSLTQAMSRARKRAGLSVRFHDTRRAGTSRFAEKLPNALNVAAVTGHRDFRTLKNYYQADIGALAEQLD